MLDPESCDKDDHRYLAIEIAPDGSVSRWSVFGMVDPADAERLRAAMAGVKFDALESA